MAWLGKVQSASGKFPQFYFLATEIFKDTDWRIDVMHVFDGGEKQRSPEVEHANSAQKSSAHWDTIVPWI